MLNSVSEYLLNVKKSATFSRALVGLVQQPTPENIVEFLTQYSANVRPKARMAEREAIRKAPAIWQMVEEGRDAAPHDLDELARYSPGTLGYSYRQFMIANGLKPGFVPTVDGIDESGIFSRRMAQTHDLWHVVTGNKTDLLGEFGNAGFYMGQFHAHGGEDAHVLMRLSATLVAAASLYAALFDLVLCRKALAGVVEGWHKGQHAKPLFAVRWEHMWDRPLNDICRELDVVPIAA
jgi:ubiquinone biosynthesis protein COQ4